jgi:hypothetical protein
MYTTKATVETKIEKGHSEAVFVNPEPCGRAQGLYGWSR